MAREISQRLRVGRTRLKLDYDLIEDCLRHCSTKKEIAGLCGTTVDTLSRVVYRDKKLLWEDYARPFYAYAASTLRRAQYNKAIEGNPALLIWLGKQWLGQFDRQAVALQQNVDIDIKNLSTEELKLLQSDPSAIGRFVAGNATKTIGDSANGNTNKYAPEKFEPHENDTVVTYEDLTNADSDRTGTEV